MGGPQPSIRQGHLDECQGTLDLRVRRAELIKKIRREVKRQGASWKSAGGHGPHEIFWLNATKIPIPRHVEIGERTTEDILHECEAVLGKGWWRK